VFGIVKQNGGHIWVYSEVGRGTTFKIYLPRAREPEALRRERPSVQPAAPRRGTETILLVEDDEGIRDLARHVLESYGYHVLAARDGAEALQIGARHPGPIHLLMTDVVMPGMNGRELSDRLRTIRPEMKCLYMSGYAANVIAHRGVLAEGVEFIQKPFTMRDLAVRVRKLLDACE
jgi:two-component system cell cycle sensor histidine kinase/response regulator CckA